MIITTNILVYKPHSNSMHITYDKMLQWRAGFHNSTWSKSSDRFQSFCDAQRLKRHTNSICRSYNDINRRENRSSHNKESDIRIICKPLWWPLDV